MVQKNVPLLFKVTERCGGKERTRPQGSQNFDDCSFNNLALPGISYYSRWHGQKRFLKTINNVCTISVAYCLLLLIWLTHETAPCNRLVLQAYTCPRLTNSLISQASYPAYQKITSFPALVWHFWKPVHHSTNILHCWPINAFFYFHLPSLLKSRMDVCIHIGCIYVRMHVCKYK